MAFTIVNGQVYTPGLAIVDAPQPYTPLGGDNLQVAIDVSGNGRIPLNSSDDSPTQFHAIHIFLTSTDLSKNLTISNGTNPTSNSSYVGPVLDLEPGSTVKHVNWIWPDCLVGDGGDSGARGDYNISMHQAFRWNGTDYYTVFDLPISVTNSIPESKDRVDCKAITNDWVNLEKVKASNASLPAQPWVNGAGADAGSSRGVRVGVKNGLVVAMAAMGLFLNM